MKILRDSGHVYDSLGPHAGCERQILFQVNALTLIKLAGWMFGEGPITYY
jgi:hypothetical protein